MKIYAFISIAVVLIGSHGAMYAMGRSDGIDSIENKSLKTELVEVKNEAQAFANRPRTRSDRIKRLCEWRDIVAKNEGVRVPELPECVD